jgi:ribosome-binding factor A
MSQRQERYARLIQEELAGLISREVKDPRVADAGLVTITRVSVTADLGLARVAVVLHGGDPAKQTALVAGLERAAPFLRAELRRRLDSKKTPELRFEIDAGAEASDRVGAILKSLHDEPKPSGE